MKRETLAVARITLAVLAGGEASRMGRPKAELEVGGRPVLAYLMDRFDWPGPTLLVTAPGRERPPGAEQFDTEAADPIAGQGPLRGLLTALEHAPTDALVVAAVDMPLVGPEYLTWLASLLFNDARLLGVMTSRGADRIEPLPCAVRAAAKDAVADALAGGMRSLHGLTRRPGFAVAAAPSHWAEETWTNVNRPAEWEAFLRRPADGA